MWCDGMVRCGDVVHQSSRAKENAMVSSASTGVASVRVMSTLTASRLSWKGKYWLNRFCVSD